MVPEATDAKDVVAVASSKMFRFVVGTEKHEFLMHSSLVAKQSPALAALVANGMQESLDGSVSWPEYDAETFGRFWEFSYAGDFASPGFRRFDQHVGTSDGAWLRRSRLGYTASEQAWVQFLDQVEIISDMRALYSFDIAWTTTPSDGDTGTLPLIALAKVFVLAECYGITRLAALATSKMINVMVERGVDRGGVEFVKFCVEGDCPESLRTLGLRYCSLFFQEFNEQPGFWDFLTGFPDSTKIVLQNVAGYLNMNAEQQYNRQAEVTGWGS